MQISESYSYLFVHIPKTGGVSIANALVDYRTGPPQHGMARWGRLLGLPRDWRKFRFRPHDSFLHVEKKIPEETLQKMFTFAFVRNPWARLFSSYSHLQRDTKHRRHKKVRYLSLAEYARYEYERGKQLQRPMIVNSKGKIGVDFVGRFEALRRDFSEVCRRIGVTAVLPHLNAAPKKKDWREAYDSASRALVTDLFREDIEAFGYSFE